MLPTPTSQFPDIQIMDKLKDPSKLRLRSSGPPRSSPSFSTPRTTRKAKAHSDDDYSGHSDEEYQRLDAELMSNFSESPVSHSMNPGAGYITLRQVDPESATVQIPLPYSLKDLKRIATKTFRLNTPHFILHGPHGEVDDANFPIIMDGDHIDVEVDKRRVPIVEQATRIPMMTSSPTSSVHSMSSLSAIAGGISMLPPMANVSSLSSLTSLPSMSSLSALPEMTSVSGEIVKEEESKKKEANMDSTAEAALALTRLASL
jgi:hypothetical protein